MKKLRILILFVLLIGIYNLNVYAAASGKLLVSSSSVYVDDTFTVTVNINSAASWNVHVSSIGPVSNCVINQANVTDDALDTNKTFTTTCKATGTGTITITLSGDVTSASDGEAVIVSSSKNVVVSSRPEPIPEINDNPVDNRSGNNKLKEIKVTGYEVEKIDNNHYKLSVPYDVKSIDVQAKATDSKAKVSGNGSHSIVTGENTIEIIITAENGAKNKIYLNVTKKDGYYLEDLDSLLKDNSDANNYDIKIKSDTTISKKNLEKMKNSKKVFSMNYYTSDNKLKYSWIIDGSNLNYTKELNTKITNDKTNKKEILRLSNYADGIIISLAQKEEIPSGVKIKYLVNNKYDDGDMINVYGYTAGSDNLNVIKSDIPVADGFIEINLDTMSEYFITMSKVPQTEIVEKTEDNKPTEVKKKTKNTIIALEIAVILGILAAMISVIIIKKKRSSLNSNV